jgi:membrane-associated protease RseP (regulator of RpoE activity)
MIKRCTVSLVLLLSFACAVSEKRTTETSVTGPVFEIVVDHIFPNSAAARGGLRPGDQVLEVNGEAFFNHTDFQDILARAPDGKKTKFTVLRKGKKVNIAFVPGRGRYRFGFRFKNRDPEIAKQLKFKIWPDEINTNYKKFTIFFQAASLMAQSSRSPQKKILHRIKEILLNKGYIFTEDQEGADFIIETEFKYPKDDTASQIKKEKKLPFEAFRIVFRDKKAGEPFLKVSGTLDPKKAKIYGMKGYVYSMIDAMIEKFPPYWDREESSSNYAVSEKKLIDDKPSSPEGRFPSASPF